jgi:hypothetical protein
MWKNIFQKNFKNKIFYFPNSSFFILESLITSKQDQEEFLAQLFARTQY